MTETLERLGYEGKLYYNKTTDFGGAGTYEVPVWTDLMECIREVTLDHERSEHDATTRGSGGFELAAAGLMKVPMNVEVLHLPEDTGYQALWQAYRDRVKIARLELDRPRDEEGAIGLRATWTILKFSQPQPKDGLMICSLVIKPARSAHVPEWWPVET